MCLFTDKILDRTILTYRRLPANASEAMLQRLQIRPMLISPNMVAIQTLGMISWANESDRGKVNRQRLLSHQDELLSAGQWEGCVMRKLMRHLVPLVFLKAA